MAPWDPLLGIRSRNFAEIWRPLRSNCRKKLDTRYSKLGEILGGGQKILPPNFSVFRWTKASSECVYWHELGRRLAVAPVKDITAFGLLLNKLLWKIGRLNGATFCTLLATSRGKHLATIQRLLFGTRPCMSRVWPPGPRKPLRGPAGHAFCGPRKILPSRRQCSRVILFFQPILWPNRELPIRENRILKLHANLEIFASNPILKAHFFRVTRKCNLKKLCLMGPLYALWNGTSFDQLGLEENLWNAVKETPVKTVVAT